MRDGEIIQIGSPRDIILEPADQFVAEFTEDISKSRVVNVGSIMEAPTLILPVSVGIDGLKNSFKNSDAAYSVCVDEEERVLGVVTRASLEADSLLGLDLGQILSKSSSQITKETSIDDAIVKIADGVTPLPVVANDSKLLGVITQKTILRSIASDR